MLVYKLNPSLRMDWRRAVTGAKYGSVVAFFILSVTVTTIWAVELSRLFAKRPPPSEYFNAYAGVPGAVALLSLSVAGQCLTMIMVALHTKYDALHTGYRLTFFVIGVGSLVMASFGVLIAFCFDISTMSNLSTVYSSQTHDLGPQRIQGLSLGATHLFLVVTVALVLDEIADRINIRVRGVDDRFTGIEDTLHKGAVPSRATTPMNTVAVDQPQQGAPDSSMQNKIPAAAATYMGFGARHKYKL